MKLSYDFVFFFWIKITASVTKIIGYFRSVQFFALVHVDTFSGYGFDEAYAQDEQLFMSNSQGYWAHPVPNIPELNMNR